MSSHGVIIVHLLRVDFQLLVDMPKESNSSRVVLSEFFQRMVSKSGVNKLQFTIALPAGGMELRSND
jgi:hypothetical protein